MTATATSFGGVIPPAVTPFTADDRIDAGAFAAELRYLTQFPIRGAAGRGSTVAGQIHGVDARNPVRT